MQRPIDALVTGFTKSPDLIARSLAPLRRLKHEGVLRDIHCVTWDSPELDPFVAPLSEIGEVKLTRVRQPDIKGSPNQRGVVYQVENLKAALALVPDEPLILKWRLDVVARHSFLREKVIGFSHYSELPDRQCFGVTMLKPAFQRKIWIPWADSNSPFFYEDAVFLGERREVDLLARLPTPADLEMLGHPHCGPYAHIVRYIKPFLDAYPLLNGYLRRLPLFRHDVNYRLKSVPYFLDSGFFWHILIAHAWILYSQFHVDIGQQSDIAFYANAVNREADWSDFSSLKITTPYDSSAGWRTGTKAGMALPSVSRVHGRLMDDGWQKALFTAEIPDMPRGTLTALMANVAGCADGRLREIEAEFYQGLNRIYQDHHAAA